MRIPTRLLVVGLSAFLGCGRAGESPDDAGDREPVADSLDTARRDSLLGESSLPGARGVKAAREVANKIEARRARIDSIAQ